MGHEQTKEQREARAEDDKVEQLGAYLVRLRFWRASALLSTSGGMWFATVSCEWTRKAN